MSELLRRSVEAAARAASALALSFTAEGEVATTWPRRHPRLHDEARRDVGTVVPLLDVGPGSPPVAETLVDYSHPREPIVYV